MDLVNNEEDLTVEEISKLCERIGKLEFEFPNKKLDRLWDILWEKLNISIEIQDHYAI